MKSNVINEPEKKKLFPPWEKYLGLSIKPSAKYFVRFPFTCIKVKILTWSN